MNKYIFISIFALSLMGASKAQSRLSSDGNAHLVRLSPNPASTYIHIDIPKNTSSSSIFQVYSFMGRKLYETRLYGNKNTLYLNDFYRGVYIYQLRDRTGALLETGKFQVLK